MSIESKPEIFELILVETELDEIENQAHTSHSKIAYLEKKGDTLRDVFSSEKKRFNIIDNDICKTLTAHEHFKLHLEDSDADVTCSFIVEQTNQQVGVRYPRIYRPILENSPNYLVAP